MLPDIQSAMRSDKKVECDRYDGTRPAVDTYQREAEMVRISEAARGSGAGNRDRQGLRTRTSCRYRNMPMK